MNTMNHKDPDFARPLSAIWATQVALAGDWGIWRIEPNVPAVAEFAV